MQLNAFSRRSIIGNDPAKIRDWAQAAEDLGYAYIEVSGACVIRAPLRMFDVRCPTDADLSMLGIAVVTFQCSSKQRLCWKALAADAGGKPQRGGGHWSGARSAPGADMQPMSDWPDQKPPQFCQHWARIP
jgi:hypothetical protein